MKGNAAIAAVAALLVGFLVFVFVEFQHGGERRGVSVGVGRAEACGDASPRCLPKTTFIDTSGQAWPPEALADKVVVVNVWATWCPPCAEEIPDLVAAYRRYKDRGVVMLGLLADTVSDVELKKFVDEHGINYPIVPMDADLARAFDYPQALPTTFIYDRRGHQRYGRPGLITADQLDAILGDTLLP